MIKISPSVLACDFAHMADDVKRVEDAGVEYLHLDVMDGMFVPNISFGVPVITSLRPCSKLVFDTHLMIEDPIRYVEVFKKAGADILTVQDGKISGIKTTWLTGYSEADGNYYKLGDVYTPTGYSAVKNAEKEGDNE